MTTRAGVNWISVSGSAAGFQFASAAICSGVTFTPSSVRSRFSSSTFKLNGSRSDSVDRTDAEVVQRATVDLEAIAGTETVSAIGHEGSFVRKCLDVKISPVGHAGRFRPAFARDSYSG